jgi:hypothetical protein
MGDHSRRIQTCIDAGRNDEAWKLTHKFQDWCYERIHAEGYSLHSAGTLLSAPQTFMIRILVADHRLRLALVHTIYQGILDGRNLKLYPKAINSLFRKCKFGETQPEVARQFYDQLKARPPAFAQTFQEIQAMVASWK